MNEKFLLGFILVILLILPISNIDAVKIPPTRAIERVTTSNGTVNAINYSTPIHLVGKGGVVITSSDNLKEIYVNAPNGGLSSIQGSNLGTHGTGVFASNFNASMLQFYKLISANSQCSISQNSTNDILTCTPGSGGTLTSINSQTGPVINIVGQTGNVTITNSTNQIQIGIGSKVVVTSGSGQNVTQKIQFNPTSNLAGFNTGSLGGTGIPTSLKVGDIWYDSIAGRMRAEWGSGPFSIVGDTITQSIENKNLKEDNALTSTSDTTKRLAWLLSGMTTGKTLTIQDNQTTTQKVSIPNIIQTETLAIKPQLTFTSASNQTGTTSTIPVMYGGGTTLTPKVTGRVELTVSGYASDSLLGDGCRIDIRYGTSSLGSNGATLTGTLAGQNTKLLSGISNGLIPFSKTVQITGLTVNTQEFFDLSFAALSGGTCTINNVDWSIKEL